MKLTAKIVLQLKINRFSIGEQTKCVREEVPLTDRNAQESMAGSSSLMERCRGVAPAGLPSARSDFSALLMGYLEPLRKRYVPGGAQLNIAGAGVSYELSAASMEAFARPLWGLAPFWAGGGTDGQLEELYRRGLVAGTDPASPAYWGACRDYDQKFVEMAAIAYALMLAPHVLWEPLSTSEREHVAAWLGQVNDRSVWENNWLFFPVLVNVAFKRLGLAWNEDLVHRNMDLIESFYRGDGWYTDGPTSGENGLIDYYNPFALHFYGLVYALFMEDADAERVERIVQRAAAFAPQYLALFSQRGESVPWGRSLTYRFAQAAFPSIALLAKSRLSTPAARELPREDVLKGVIARNLAIWNALPTRDNGGVLTVGYHYPCLTMAERYNAPGSPLWAFKAFALLALPADDPVWSIAPAPLPCADGVQDIAGGEMVVRRAAGEATLYVGGRRGAYKFAHTEAKYSKFAYSSKYGFSVPVSQYTLAEAAPDSMLAFEVDGLVRVRVITKEYHRDGDALVMRWSPVSGIEVVTRLMPTPYGHLREHEVTSTVSCRAWDCGFAIPAERPEDAQGICTVACNAENGLEGTEELIKAAPNTNLMAPKTFIHAVRYEIPVGTSHFSTEVHE